MIDNQSNNKRIAKNTVFLYFRMFLVLIVSLFTTRVVLNALGVVDYGINNVVAGFVSMFAFLNTSMSNGVQRFYNFTLGKKDGNIANVYNTAWQIQFLLALILLLLLETLGVWYMYNKMIIPSERFTAAMWVFQLSVASMLLIVMQIPYNAAIMAFERMDFYAYISIFDVIAKLGIAYLLFVYNGDKLILYGALLFVVTIVGFFLNYGYCKKNFKELNFKMQYNRELFRPLLSFSGWNVFGSFAYMLKGQGLNMLLNAFFGPVVNAARGISGMIMSAIQGFQGNIVIAFRPQIVQSYSYGDYARVRGLFYSLSKVSFVMLAMMSIPIILELDYILHLWLGDIVPDYTKSFTILVLVNMVVSSLNTPVSQVVHATGKMKNYQIATSFIVCLILPISWVFLKIGYNPNSVYIVSLAMTILNQIVCNIFLKKVFPYSFTEYISSVIFPCVIFTVIVPIIPIVLQSVIEQSFIRLIVVGMVSVIISLIVAYLAMLNKHEKKLVKNIINKKIKW